MDALNKNFPVGQPDTNGNYEWMRIRAGGGISSTGDVDVRDGDLEMNGGTIRNAQFDPPIGGNLPTPINLPNPFVLEVADDKAYTTGDIFPPEIFTWDELISQPTTLQFGGPPVPITYNGTLGQITINKIGCYDIELCLNCSIENETVPSSKLVLFLVEGDINAPTNIVLQVTARPSGQDVSTTHTSRRVVNVDSVPLILSVGVQVIDPNPTETILVHGSSFLGNGYTNLKIQYINDTPQLPIDVRPTV